MALTTDELIAAFRAGDRRACGRLLSLVENEPREAVRVLDALYPLTGRAYRVGVTGPPGAGKSTLVEKLARECRTRSKTVGIVAVDPTSPFSGGAVLGDRVRMPSLFTDPGVFIRSMATHGGMGGLAVRTREVCDVLDAFGLDYVIIETVGVGQVELDVAGTAHSTVVVLVPESGDAIQTMKAGLMEIGQVFCINKSDREGADRLAMEVEAMVELRSKDNNWVPPVVKTVATTGLGVSGLLDRLEEYRTWFEQTGAADGRREQTIANEVVELVDEQVRRDLWQRPETGRRLALEVQKVMQGDSTPYRAAQRILDELLPIRKEP